jgi:hypothetical protein
MARVDLPELAEKPGWRKRTWQNRPYGLPEPAIRLLRPGGVAAPAERKRELRPGVAGLRPQGSGRGMVRLLTVFSAAELTLRFVTSSRISRFDSSTFRIR